MDYGTLRVTTPDGQVREYPIDVPSVIVGRSEGNGVVIDHVSVSRRHAQLHLDDEGLKIEDIGSANGTFVGSQRLTPGTQQRVEDGQQVRFGDVEAVYLPPRAAGGEASAGPGAAAAAPVGDTQGTIGVSLTSPSSPVAAGAATTATVVVQNRGPVVDQLQLSVLDLPESWVRIGRPSLSLVSGAKDEVTIVIQPPRSPEASAGEHPFSVSVVSSENGREVRVLGTCTILPFEGFAMQLESQGGFHVRVENEGNSPLTVALSTQGEGRVDASLGRETVELAPGQAESVPLKASPKGRPLFGAVEVRPFRVSARPSRGGKELTADGQIIVKPPLRWWRWPTAAILVLGVLGGGGYTYSRMCGDNGWPGCSSSDNKAAATVPASSSQPPGSPTSAVPSPTPISTKFKVGDLAKVTADGGGLRVRPNPGLADANKELTQLTAGAPVTITGGPTAADDLIWWKVKTEGGTAVEGWATEKFLEKR